MGDKSVFLSTGLAEGGHRVMAESLAKTTIHTLSPFTQYPLTTYRPAPSASSSLAARLLSSTNVSNLIMINLHEFT